MHRKRDCKIGLGDRFLGGNFQSRSPEFKVGQSVLCAGDRRRGKVGLLASKSVSRCLWGRRVRHGRRDFYTACGFLQRPIAPLPFDKNYFDAGCTRPRQSMGDQESFFEKKGRGFLNLTPNYRSRPLHQTHAPQPTPTGDPGLVSLGFAPV